MVFCQTRARIGLDTFNTASQHVLDEAELCEEWSETLVDEEESDLEDALKSAAADFDAFMGEPATASRRSRLELPHECPGVRREVRGEIDRRAKAAQ